MGGGEGLISNSSCFDPALIGTLDARGWSAVTRFANAKGSWKDELGQSIMFLQPSLLSVLKKAHCRSTHHYFALDALPLVQTPSGRRLVEVLLRFHERYLTGATDPDTRFRDFQNHVIHVKNGYWGGAPRMAHKWYARMQRYLRTNRFSDAAHAAGVLSHYFTDPFQPLHTEQSEREKILHRPVEWSIQQSYQQIFDCWQNSDMEIVFQLSDRTGWLGESMLHASRFANRKCTELLEEFDLLRAVDNPTTGLNAGVQDSLAELFGLAMTGWGRVLERAAAEAEATRESQIPSQPGMLAMVSAMVRIPEKYWRQYIERSEEQWQIALMLQEYADHGDLTRHLPAEVDIVHRVVDIYQAEQLWQQSRADDGTRVSVQKPVVSKKPGNDKSVDTSATEKPLSQTNCVAESAPVSTSAMQVDASVLLSEVEFLLPSHCIHSQASSRLATVGVHTVGDFLRCSAHDLSVHLCSLGITPEMVRQWQMHVSLMVHMPGIGKRAVQLLVAAGYMTATAISKTPPKLLYQEISAVASTSTGRSFLQGALGPGPAEVAAWFAIASAHADLSVSRAA